MTCCFDFFSFSLDSFFFFFPFVFSINSNNSGLEVLRFGVYTFSTLFAKSSLCFKIGPYNSRILRSISLSVSVSFVPSKNTPFFAIRIGLFSLTNKYTLLADSTSTAKFKYSLNILLYSPRLILFSTIMSLTSDKMLAAPNPLAPFSELS